MYKIIFAVIFTALSIFLFYSCSSSKKLEYVNYTEDNSSKGIGGKFAPAKTLAKSNLNIFVVFAQFKDDKKDPADKIWPVNKLPVWANEFIGSDPGKAPFEPFSLSNYFYEMSYGQNIITGYVYPELVVLDLPSSTYFGQANNKVLEEVDKNTDFRKFDNWDNRTANKQFYNRPDNYVDAVYIIFRNLPTQSWGGIALLGTTFKTNDGPIISSRIPTISMTLNIGKKGNYGYEDKTILLAHEYAHYLLGESHNFEPEFSGRGENQRGIGLMPGSYGTFAMNPEEKYLLGYTKFADIFENSTGTLPDFQQSGKAYRIPIPLKKDGMLNTDPDEYFIIANHQKISKYENTKGKGIYIYHVKNKAYGANQMSVVCADGLWQWKALKWMKRPVGIGGPIDWVNQNGAGNPLSQNMPVIVHDHVDRINGRDELQEVLLAKNDNQGEKSYWWDRWIDENGKVIENSLGDEKDAFNMGYNELFSPWSNPASYDKTHKPTYVTVPLLENNDGVFKLQFYVDSLSSMQAPPSKPQNLNYSFAGKKVTLTWEPNIEPDMKMGGYYKIYRAAAASNQGNPIVYNFIANIEAYTGKEAVTTWTDTDIKPNAKYYYKISAVDSTSEESVKSDSVEVSF